MSKNNLLTLLILLSLLLGVLFGQYVLFDPHAPIGDDHWTKAAGDLMLIRPLTLLVVPLIFVSVVVGVTSVGNPSKLGLIGGSTAVYYLVTMLMAAILGTILVTTLRPGHLPDAERTMLIERAEADYRARPDIVASIERARAEQKTDLSGAWRSILDQMIPTNIVREMSEGRALGIIVFSLLLGLGLAAGGEATLPAVRVFEALFDTMMRLVQWIVWLTPIGVFFLAAWTIGRIGFDVLIGPLSMYMLLVVAGLAIYSMIVLPGVLTICTRSNPYRFMWQMRKALLTAFGTNSSTATLPVTIETAETEGKCSKRASNLVLPLGATVNMDGTALYEAIAVVFLFQLYGVELEFSQLLIVVITATLAAVGAAGMPSAALVTMLIVVTAVNRTLPASQQLPIESIGIIIGVDRILDMCRTTVNVWGDAVGAKIITLLAPDTPDEFEKAIVG